MAITGDLYKLGLLDFTVQCTGPPPPELATNGNWSNRYGQHKRAVRILLECFLVTVLNVSCGKVMFSQASVCLWKGGVHGKGGACVAKGGHAWWKGVCISRGHTWQGGMHGREWQGACVAEETATAADGTHPTGMHSCSTFVRSSMTSGFCCCVGQDNFLNPCLNRQVKILQEYQQLFVFASSSGQVKFAVTRTDGLFDVNS